MHLRNYIQSLNRDERSEFAARCGTTVGHLNNVSYGYKPCSEKLASLIERESGSAVRRQDMRPDDWAVIWPELAKKPRRSTAEQGA